MNATTAMVPFGHDLRAIRGPVLRFIGWLLATPAASPTPCGQCNRLGHHAPWCAFSVRESHERIH